MSSNLGNLAQHVRARRDELGLTQIEVWHAGGPSNSTLTAVEAGSAEPALSTLRKLDVGLRWEPGSARAALYGGTPTPLTTDQPAPGHPLHAATDAELLAEIARRFARATRRESRDEPTTTTVGPDLPPGRAPLSADELAHLRRVTDREVSAWRRRPGVPAADREAAIAGLEGRYAAEVALARSGESDTSGHAHRA